MKKHESPRAGRKEERTRSRRCPRSPVETCPALPLWIFITQSLANWIVFSILLYFGSLIVSKSSFRFIDVLGTQALARSPYILASLIGFSNSISLFGKYILWNFTHKGEPISISGGTITVAIFLLILDLFLTIWLITLMFNAFRVSTNLKGNKSVVLFIIIFVLSMVITSIISLHFLLKII